MPVTIDGTSESAFLQANGGGTASIDIGGGGITGSADGLTLASGSDGSTIDGLGVLDFSGPGIVVQTANNTIGGTDSGAGNVIGFNAQAGVSISGAGATGNVLLGNDIGIDKTDNAMANAIGVAIDAGQNTIGGTASGSQNLIDSNTSAGISISGAAATGNVVLGNGIQGNNVGVILDSANNTIGGTDSGAGNFIIDDTTVGVSISGAANVLLGDTIGATAGDGVGVVVTSASNTIGGTASGAANTIPDNNGAGVSISGASASSNVLLGNTITQGTGVGVVIGTANNTIGGIGGGENRIEAFGTGVSISGASATANLVIGDTIESDGVGAIIGSASNTIGGTISARGT